MLREPLHLNRMLHPRYRESMPEYEKKIYGGVLRIPHEVVEFLGDRVRLIADYRSLIVVKSGAPPDLVSESLRYIADVISKEAKAREERKK